jgi:hypothetical protein
MCALGRDMQGAIGGALPPSSILGSPAIGGAAMRSTRGGRGTLLTGSQSTAAGSSGGGSGSLGGSVSKPRLPNQER